MFSLLILLNTPILIVIVDSRSPEYNYANPYVSKGEHVAVHCALPVSKCPLSAFVVSFIPSVFDSTSDDLSTILQK